MAIQWKPEYSVGVDAIDSQHRQLIEIINDLNKPDDEIELLRIALKVKRYIESHCAFEEGLMRKLQYPKMAEHVAQHDRLRAQYEEFLHGPRDEAAAGKTRMMIYKWFVGHVIHDKMDRELGMFLKRVGVFLPVKDLA